MNDSKNDAQILKLAPALVSAYERLEEAQKNFDRAMANAKEATERAAQILEELNHFSAPTRRD